jgi:hypothetical protein
VVSPDKEEADEISIWEGVDWDGVDDDIKIDASPDGDGADVDVDGDDS